MLPGAYVLSTVHCFTRPDAPPAVLAQAPYGLQEHLHPAIVLSSDDYFVYINSGSRTDHGERSEDGAFARVVGHFANAGGWSRHSDSDR